MRSCASAARSSGKHRFDRGAQATRVGELAQVGASRAHEDVVALEPSRSTGSAMVTSRPPVRRAANACSAADGLRPELAQEAPVARRRAGDHARAARDPELDGEVPPA
jgi:hypothetical protein